MKSVGINEARSHLSALLDQVARGKKVVITRRGKPAALLVPAPEEGTGDVQEAVTQMLAYRDQRRRALGAPVREFIEEGRHR